MGKWIKIKPEGNKSQLEALQSIKKSWIKNGPPGITKRRHELQGKEKGHSQAIIETENAKES